MALLRYFKPVNGHLPDPAGPLSAHIPPSTIRQANLDVLSVEKLDARAKTPQSSDHPCRKEPASHQIVGLCEHTVQLPSGCLSVLKW